MKSASRDARRRQADIERQARAWIRLLASGQATLHDAEALKLWCAASEAHAAAFALELRFWNQVGPAAQQLQRQTARASHERPVARAWGRRAFLGTALGGTAAAAIAAVVAPPFGLWRSFDEWDADYRTDTGGRRQFGLDRQVQVDMNTQTSIALRPDVAGALGMELITGEAAFEALAPDRKVTVLAGAGKASASQAKFELRRTGSSVCLTCVGGEVALSHAGGELVLAPRQQVSYDREQVGAIQTIDPDETSAWRQGALVFRQTPLPAVVAEINRYRRGHVVLLDGKRGASAMSGRFEIRDMEKVLVQIERAFGLNATRLPGNVVLLS
ncbi:FecR family protein [Achromobacter sp. AONIH1]|uniref:FecR family protein n=1 Tax=Achromobacter sp. AONIH1 TaxID=1758194 RepID=UPI000CD26B41|nr:FecR domain-containing protein [Achromobacter sp. AONIH1]AUT48162.1 iron dicitrate transport regulator FecR [Achromobacter sp. AONIH1]